MRIHSQSYEHHRDFEAVMSFLRDAYLQTKDLQNWLPPRFENSGKENEKDTQIWVETDANQVRRIIAMANPETTLRYFIQIHHDYTFLEEEIIKWIESINFQLKHERKEKKIISIISLEGNPAREILLKQHRFMKGALYGILRLRDLDSPIPEFRIPEGFTIRSVDPENDFDKLAKATRLVFGHGEWFNRKVLERISRSSFYHKDLDLVAVNREGDIVSFCTFRFDSPSGITELEPMGTLPDFRRLGLAKALICEGLKRLENYNPTLLYIGGAADTSATNKLYNVTGFTKQYNYYFWNKTIKKVK